MPRTARARRAALCLLASLLVGTVGACASTQQNGTTTARRDMNLITRAQLLEHDFTTAADAVAALHSNWLHTRGTDSFSTPSQVQVYVDGMRYGGVETLASIAVGSISFIRYYDGITASARWGLDHGQGVIFVSTTPVELLTDSVRRLRHAVLVGTIGRSP